MWSSSLPGLRVSNRRLRAVCWLACFAFLALFCSPSGSWLSAQQSDAPVSLTAVEWTALKSLLADYKATTLQLQEQVSMLQTQLAQAQADSSALRTQLTQSQETLQTAKARLETLQAALASSATSTNGLTASLMKSKADANDREVLIGGVAFTAGGIAFLVISGLTNHLK